MCSVALAAALEELAVVRVGGEVAKMAGRAAVAMRAGAAVAA